MTREEALEFIAQSVKNDVDMALVADAIEALQQDTRGGRRMTKEQFIYALTACGCLLKYGKTWYEHNELIKCFEDLGLFEQEPILDKIRAEIVEMRSKQNCSCADCLDIIDKYKEEQEKT